MFNYFLGEKYTARRAFKLNLNKSTAVLTEAFAVSAARVAQILL